MACFDALGCRDFSRVDFIVSEDGTPYALEANTIPGFTTHSLLPEGGGEDRHSDERSVRPDRPDDDGTAKQGSEIVMFDF